MINESYELPFFINKGYMMSSLKVFLNKDIEKVGLAGEIIKVKEGFARNYLIPKKLATEITSKNESFFLKREKTIDNRSKVIASKSSMLAEKIESLKITLKRKIHGVNELYGSVSPAEIVELLAGKGFSIAKNQVEFSKAIKKTGAYEVTIKLSSKLKPKLKITVVAEK